MKQEMINEILNRLLVIHNRSLPTYLKSAVPWWQDHGAHEQAVFAQIVADQQHIVARAGALIAAKHGRVNSGEFPISFAALHDLAGEFLTLRMLDYQRRSVAAIEKITDQLADLPREHALAQQALGMARAHLDMLGELVRHAAPQQIARE